MRTDVTAERGHDEGRPGAFVVGLYPGRFDTNLVATGGRGVTIRGTRLLAAVAVVACIGFASAATAAVSPQDQKCITAFNKSLRNVAKAQSGIIKKCLTEFAAGKLSNTTPESTWPGCMKQLSLTHSHTSV